MIVFIVALGILLSLLAGCRPDTPSSREPAAEKPSASQEPVGTLEPTATSTEVPATDTPPATQTQVHTSTKSTFIEDPVLNDINERWEAYILASQLLNQLIQDMAADPNLLVDEVWKREVGFVLNVLDLAANDLAAISDSPPEYAQLEENMHAIAMETYMLIDNFSFAVSNLDADAMGAATQNIRAIAEFTHMVNDELESLLSE